jgi:hypothetical protein
MPKGTWMEEKNVILIYRYVLEIKMQLNQEKIPKITKRDIGEHKLWGSLNRYKSIKRIIHLVYPNQYNEFDFFRVPKDYWADKSKIKDRLELKLNEHGYMINDIPKIITCETLIAWGFSNPLKRFEHSPFQLINALYPGRFKPTEFKKSPQRSSKVPDFLRKQFFHMLEQEGIQFKDIPKKVTQELLNKYRFSAALKQYNGSPSKLILSLFPNDFSLQDFNTPNGFWKDENNIRKAFEKLLRDKNIPHQDIPKICTKKFFIENGLYGLLQEYNSSPIELIMKLYPNDFIITDFIRVPNKYWYNKNNRIQALRDYCKRHNIKRHDLPRLTRAYFKQHFPRFISLVDRHYESKFYLWIIESFPEYTFEPAEFQLLIGKDGQFCDSKEELVIHNYLYEKISPQAVLKREGIRLINEQDKETYIPDWIIEKDGQKLIIEYFGLYGSSKFPGYTKKANRKIKFYQNLKDYQFIAIMPDDLKVDGLERVGALLRELGL